MPGYQPARYGSPVINGRSAAMANAPVDKGFNNVKVDIAKMQRSVERLSRYYNTQIAELPSEEQWVYRDVDNYAKLLKGTEEFRTLRAIIQKHTQGYGHPIPGTVGAYLNGCMVGSNLANPGCGIGCAGNIPATSESTSCGNSVILARPRDGGFTFTQSYSSQDREGRRTAYVFVPYTSLDAFPGFSTDERQALANYGVERVVLYGYTMQSPTAAITPDNYVELSNTPLNMVKSRGGSGGGGGGSSNNGGQTNGQGLLRGGTLFWLIIGLLILLIIIGAVTWNRRRRAVTYYNA